MNGRRLREEVKRIPRNIWVLTLTSLFTDISSEMILNLIPLFLANVLGVRTGLIGVVEGVAESVASLLKVFSGWFSDRMRARKRLAVLGYGLSTLAKPLFFFATSWWGVLGIRFLDRVGKGIRTAPRDALVADSVEADQRGGAFGLHRAGDTIGAGIGLAFALLMLSLTQKNQALLSRSTFQLIAVLSFVPAVLGVGVLALGARDVAIVEERPIPRFAFAGLGKDFQRFLFVVLIFTLGNSSDAFLILRAQDVGLSVLGILGAMLLFNLVYAVISGPAGILSDRLGRGRLLLFGWFLYALVYLGFGLAKQGWHTWILWGVYGIYYGSTEGVTKAMIADLVVEEKRGTAYGMYHAAVGVVAFPASLLAGLLWQGAGSWSGFGAGAPFYVGSVLAILAAGMFWLFFVRRQEPSSYGMQRRDE